MTGASASHWVGFQELVTRVTIGQVGLILSVDVTRLSRNCSYWYPLLDICGYRGCLIADRDGIYDPGSANGRLLLGLKGQLSELELHTIRARMTAGLLEPCATRRVGLNPSHRPGTRSHWKSPQRSQSRNCRSPRSHFYDLSASQICQQSAAVS